MKIRNMNVNDNEEVISHFRNLENVEQALNRHYFIRFSSDINKNISVLTLNL